MRIRPALLALLTVLLALPAFSQANFDPEGRFTYVLNDEIVAEEDFTFATREDGNLEMNSVFLLLSEEFQLEFETDRLFDQTLVLTPELGLVRFELASETAQGQLNVTAAVEGGVATIRFTTVDAEDDEERSGEVDVILEDNVVASGVSGSGAQLSVLQQLILRRGVERETALLAFNPTSLDRPLVEVTIAPLDPVTVEAGNERFEAARFSVSQLLQGEDGDEFTVELLSREGKMIGYRALSQTSTLLVYRSDLFPDGIAIVES